MATPRPTTQTTNRSRSRSVLQQHQQQQQQQQQKIPLGDPKMRGSIGSLTDRGNSFATSTSTILPSSRGDHSQQQLDLSQQQEEQPQVQDTSDLPFFKQDQFTDVVLQVGGKKLYTSRALLAYNSPVMAKILSSGSSKNKDLDLPEKEFEDVVELLAYIDPRVDYIITEQSAIALLPLAEEYGVASLKQLCEQTIMKSFRALRKGKHKGEIPVEISLEYLHIADKYEFPGLRNIVTDEFVNNEDPSATKALLESSLISEHVKLNVLDKKVDKVHFELDKERRERTAVETKLGDYGNKRFRRILQD